MRMSAFGFLSRFKNILMLPKNFYVHDKFKSRREQKDQSSAESSHRKVLPFQ